MKTLRKSSFKQIFYLILLFVLIFASPVFAESRSINSPKAIILVIDQVGVQNLVAANNPNMDLLIGRGGFGIMNARPEAIVNRNRASSYLTLGMGTRITAPEKDNWDLQRNSSGSWSLLDFNLIKNKVSQEKLDRLGYIGKTAKANGLVIGLLGNADYKGQAHKEGALLAIDEQGIIPIYHPEVNKLSSSELEAILNSVDILFIDFGQTVIANKESEDQLVKAIENADKFLHKIIEEIGINDNLFMVITPNPSEKGFRNLNLALTPVIIADPSIEVKNGLLTSSSTKRDGLVTNLNFTPTLFSFFGIEGVGEKIFTSTTPESLENYLVRSEKLYLNLNKTRYLLHGTYIFLILLILVTTYTNKLKVLKRPKLIQWLSLTIISIPFASMIAPLIIDYSSIFIGHIIIILVAVVLVWVFIALKKTFIESIAWISLLTAIFILADTFLKANYLLDTPFGFNDVIIGGRFYGINNDLMGILIGTSIIGVFSLGERYKLKTSTLLLIGLVFTSSTVLALSPAYGANVGGTIGATVVLIVSILVTLNKKLSFKRMVAILVSVFVIEIGIAALDAVGSNEMTHAGKLFNSIITNGINVFYGMILIKLKQVLLMIVLPPWNIVLLLQVYILWRLLKEQEQLDHLKNHYPILYKGFTTIVIGSLVIFAFNDTGVISSAIMLTYLLIPIGYLINFEKREG